MLNYFFVRTNAPWQPRLSQNNNNNNAPWQPRLSQNNNNNNARWQPRLSQNDRERVDAAKYLGTEYGIASSI